MNSRKSVRAAVTLVRCCVFRFIVAYSVVVFRTFDVNVVFVVLDAVFFVEVFVDFMAKSWQQPSLVNHAVQKSDKKSVEDNLPDQLRKDVGRIKSDCPQFIPE